MVSREKLLEAAAQVFAEAGFRGATTRRIAEVAGVNEVTIFRLFGSKSQLLTEAIHCVQPAACVRPLPPEPGDVERELVAWSGAHLEGMRAMRTVIRRTMAELDEHPDMRSVVSDAKAPYLHQLFDYMCRVVPPESEAQRLHLRAACTMLTSSLFADAIGRDVVPGAYPSPVEDAAELYVRAFLAALRPEASTPAGVAPPAGVG